MKAMERSRSEAEIDDTLAQSFPASDPPSWTLGDEPAAPRIEGEREMAQHSHEWLCARIVDEAKDAIILADREGVRFSILWEGPRRIEVIAASIEVAVAFGLSTGTTA